MESSDRIRPTPICDFIPPIAPLQNAAFNALRSEAKGLVGIDFSPGSAVLIDADGTHPALRILFIAPPSKNTKGLPFAVEQEDQFRTCMRSILAEIKNIPSDGKMVIPNFW